MDDSTNALAWPTTPGHITVKPLSAKSPCKVWLIRRESDQSYMALKLSLTMENVNSLRQVDVTQSRKYVVDFYGTIQTQLGEGLVMEYCPGGSVEQLVRSRSPFSLGECVTALAPIAQTLSAMHAEGQRHGDLSPANILLTAKGMPKIIDFQESATAGEAFSGAGTPGFMAPEAAASGMEEHVGAQDVYSLAACLWYLLAGQAPEEELMRPPVTVKFPGVPASIHDLLVDSLSSDPGIRPTAEQFARTLFSSRPAEPIRWEGHVAPESTHLMETIHPEAGKLATRKRGRRAGKSSTRQQAAQGAGGWHSQHLRRTPGGLKLFCVAMLGLAVLAASIAGVSHFRSAQATETVAEPSPSAQEPTCRIHDVGQVQACALQRDSVISAFLGLSRQRDAAMGALSAEELKPLYAPGSEQLQRDLQTISELEDLGLRFEGLATHLEDIEIIARSQGDTVVLGATSTQDEYRYVDARGTVIHTVQAAPAQRIEIELVLEEGQWQLGKVLRH